jgi:predicted O-methyltransferase YrrM
MRTLRHFLKYIFGLAAAETQTTVEERDCIAKFARGLHTAAEIGVWHGVTSRRILQSLDPEGIFYAIDPYPKGRLGISLEQIIAHREVAKERFHGVRWIRMSGVDAGRHLASSIAGKLEFLFIDGDHSYDGLRGDWETWSSLMGPNGIVCLHDSRSTLRRNIENAGSVRFTEEVILKDIRFEVIATVDSLTALRRKM